MLWVDIKYLNLISVNLSLFKKKSDSLWNFRCPYCLDSKKKKSKARGYMYRKGNDLFFKCHNCNKGTTMSNFLQNLDSDLHKKYVMERFISGDQHPNHNYKKPILLSSKAKETFEKKKEIYNIGLPSIKELPDKHFAKTYVSSREIPQEHWNKIFFANDFRDFVSKWNPDKFGTLKPRDPRLVIPFFDKSGNMIAFQGRALEDSSVRYITIKIKEESQKIFGLERLNTNNVVYVVEGPIDSLFLKNCIAAADAELSKLIKEYKNAVFIFDNEPNNKEIVDNMKKVLDEGSKIVIWDPSIKHKDINDMILDNIDVHSLIEKNTYSGLEGIAKYSFWKRV